MPSLLVKRAELEKSLKILVKSLKPKNLPDAIWSFEDRELSIDLAGHTVIVPAVGVWPGQARTSGQFALTLAKMPPNSDLLTFRVAEGRLHVEQFSTHCVWQGAEAAVIQLPVNPSLTQLLRVRFTYSETEIEQSGLTKVIQSAVERREALVSKAADILAPLEIFSHDLRQWIDERVTADVRRILNGGVTSKDTS